MDIVFLILIILSALLLIILVMLQDEGGEGLGGIFGGGSSTPFGSRSGNVLTKITTILAAVFLLCTIGLAYMKRTPRESGDVSDLAREELYEGSNEQLWYVVEPEIEESGTTEEGQLPDTDEGPSFTEGDKLPDTSSAEDQ